MEYINDETLWYEAWLDTPLDIPYIRQRAARMPDDLLDVPGVCVKTRKLIAQWPVECGLLVSYEANAVVVRGHGSPVSGKFVWRGTVAEYRATWTVD